MPSFDENGRLKISLSGSGTPVFPSITVVEGFTASDYYQSPVNALSGSTNFTAIWYGFVGGFASNVQFVMGNQNGSLHGWSIGFNEKNTSGNASFMDFLINNEFAGVINTSPAYLDGDDYAGLMKPMHLAIRYTGGELRAFLNGNSTRFYETTSGFTVASGTRFRVGVGPFGSPAVMLGFAGAGYISSGLTDIQLQDHLQDCRDAGHRFVAGNISWEHRYDVQEPGGSFPSQIDDLVGSAHLERVGTAITGTRSRRIV